MWLDTDMVKAGTTFTIIERKNEAFARGWRMGISHVINIIEREFE